jgi:hypothetical protein
LERRRKDQVKRSLVVMMSFLAMNDSNTREMKSVTTTMMTFAMVIQTIVVRPYAILSSGETYAS